MKNLWIVIFFLGAGCASTADDGAREENLKSGEVTQLAFASNGKNLVVINEFRFFNTAREKCHSRLRSFSTADWKATADTKELSMIDLTLAAAGGQPWVLRGTDFNRSGRGNPMNGPVFYKLECLTLERTPLDVIQQGRDNIAFSGSAIACSADRPLCVLHLTKYLSPQPLPQFTFVFDLKAGKKTVDLQDCPTAKAATGDFAGPALAFAPNGRHVACFQLATPYQMQLHDADTGKLLKSMKVKSPVGAIQFSPNGKFLALMCQDGTLLILHPDLSGRIFSKQFQSFTFAKYGGFPKPIGFVGDGNLAVVSSDATVELLDTKEWKSVRTFKTNQGENNLITCVAGSPDGKLLAVGFGQTNVYPGLVRVWEADSGKLVKELK